MGRGGQFEGLPEPQRCRRHLLLDHLHRDGGRDGVLLDGIHGGGRPLEDLHERGCVGDLGRSSALLLHARVLGPDRPLPHRLPLHRLVDHRPPADDRVLLLPLCGAAQPQLWHVLAPAGGHRCHLAFGYAGETGSIEAIAGFVLGICGWFYILYEIFAGEAGKVAASGDKVGENVRSSFETMRFIVSVGWSIYPLGYFFGYLCGSVSDEALNVVYNIADVINKIAFCLAIWASAKKDTAERQAQSLLA